MWLGGRHVSPAVIRVVLNVSEGLKVAVITGLAARPRQALGLSGTHVWPRHFTLRVL